MQDPQKSVSAETFSEAVKEEEPTRFQDLLQHTRADAVVAIADALSHAAPAVDAKTCIPHWHGEDCDYGMAIAALRQRDG